MQQENINRYDVHIHHPTSSLTSAPVAIRSANKHTTRPYLSKSESLGLLSAIASYGFSPRSQSALLARFTPYTLLHPLVFAFALEKMGASICLLLFWLRFPVESEMRRLGSKGGILSLQQVLGCVRPHAGAPGEPVVDAAPGPHSPPTFPFLALAAPSLISRLDDAQISLRPSFSRDRYGHPAPFPLASLAFFSLLLLRSIPFSLSSIQYSAFLSCSSIGPSFSILASLWGLLFQCTRPLLFKGPC